MRRILVAALAMISFHVASAQNLSISGTIRDQQAKTALQRATVRLFSRTDSAFVKSSISDSTGRFNFSGLSRDSFLLYVSSVGYKEISQIVKLDTTSVNLDILATPSASSELATIVITANVAPVSQKGDTLQVSASQFKVNPDASAEDMMKKVPGITIENGQVKAQGEVVQKVTLDGRELFGDDATAALRNLPAEVIDKIQIFDRLSDQAQLTGFDDGNTAKGINIITKANMRNGQFGRVFAGYGKDVSNKEDRYQAGGNATILKDNRRISLVGNFNNTNQQNFSQQDLLGVTSAGNQRGGGGGGPQQQRGGPGGGGGGGGFQGGGGNFGGGGGGGNFNVGPQQVGINKTNAFGINFSDIWAKKLTVTGSYFFNRTNNNTDQISNTQYFAGTFLNSLDSTLSNSQNTNHRINMRFEYRMDSANTFIITPNLSFQDNESERRTARDASFVPGYSLTKRVNENTTNSNRTGNNMSTGILYRHSFPKRGRSISINLNASSNDREGDSYVTTFQRSYSGTTFRDTSSRRFTDQANNGTNLSTNINYTEPLSQQSQLQLTYNPSVSKSKSDQETFGYNFTEGKYSAFLDSLSNKFENKTVSQNAGVSYRWNDRDRQISFGVNYQNTNLQSDQTFPRKLNVNKSFSNFLPNAMIRYKISPRSNIRLFYRSNVNNPNVNQLQNVIDITNAPYFSVGNPDLEPQFMSTGSSQYTYTNTAKSLLFVANIFYQTATNYISNASFTPTRDSLVNGQVLRLGDQLTKPVNLDGFKSTRLNFTFAVPIKLIKTNFSVDMEGRYTTTPGIVNNITNETKTKVLQATGRLTSNISEFVDFNVSYTARFNDVSNETFPTRNDSYYQDQISAQLNLLTKSGWFLQNDLTNDRYTGLAEGFNQSYTLWNAGIGKKFLKSRKAELRFNVFDLLKQNQSITRNVTESYIQDVQNQVLQQFFMLTFTYNLRTFGTAAQRAQNRGQMRENFMQR